MPCLAERQAGFAAALRNPALPVPDGLIGPDGLATPCRFAVYRNNVSVALIDALAANYPATSKIVGEEFFRAMARTYAMAEPPSSPVLLDYGATFPEFIASFAPAKSLPYLCDVARVERAWTEAYHSQEADSLDPQSLSRIPHEQITSLVFAIHPSVRIVLSRFPALTIWRMNVADGVAAPVDLDAGGENILVVRREADVEVRSIPPGAADFIFALGLGRPLMQAVEAALETAGDFDLALSLSSLIAAGAFTEITRTAKADLDDGADPRG